MFTWLMIKEKDRPDIGGPHGPYKQSERTSVYQNHAEKLLRSGHAYRCFCSTGRLNSLAKERNGLGLPNDYDRTCISIPIGESEERASIGEQHVVRLKFPEVPPVYIDLVYGVVGQRKSKEGSKAPRPQLSFEDPVLIKSDGHPTYHLANVVDDHQMGITHVIRAVEWMSSTPKHIAMYNAFDWKPPSFAHVGLLQDASRQKFSKRNLALDINSYRKEGDDQLNLEDLVRNFDLKFTKGNTIAAPNKLIHLQKRYAQKYVEEEGKEYLAMIDKILANVLVTLSRSRICPASEVKDRIAALLNADAKKYTTPSEFVERNSQFFFFEPREKYHRGASDSILTENIGTIIDHFREILPEQWDEPSLREAFENMADNLSTKWGQDSNQSVNLAKASRASVQHFLRWALTGGRPGPTLMFTMSILGRNVSLRRIEDAAAVLDNMTLEKNQGST
ncbi:MAG: Glutamate--tRNA ligase mitochondrial [Alectoria sarmentosa]|nr:MAG: Glutamate--tRNA ligase mitochondrial [Alectoria sarmentosa]